MDFLPPGRPGKLAGRGRWAWLAPALVSVVVLVLAACGGSTAAPDSAAGDGRQPALVPSPGEAGPGTTGAGPSVAGPVGDGPFSLQDLEAEAIVAAEEQLLNRIYQAVVPSVVQVRVTRRMAAQPGSPLLPDIPGLPFGAPDGPRGPDDFFSQGSGSGFVWDDRSRIVTNHHVIQDADRVVVVFPDGTELPAQLLGSDPDSDLAVLQIDSPEGAVPPVPLGDSGALLVGQMAVAIGNPFGQEFSLTSGIISALGRTIRSGSSSFSIPQVIQTDAPINPGNSGGPLLDRRGRVIGVNTQIISPTGSNAGVGFAVPINTAKRVVPALISQGRYEYAWLGISGATLRPDAAELMGLPRHTRGTVVVQVTEDSPAQGAGLRGSDRTLTREGVQYPLGGDVIIAIAGAPVATMDDLIAHMVDNTRPGDRVTLEVIRQGGQRQHLQVTLAKRPG